jgi:hypothetical protein
MLEEQKGNELWRDWEKVQKERMKENMTEEAVGDVLQRTNVLSPKRAQGYIRQTVQRKAICSVMVCSYLSSGYLVVCRRYVIPTSFTRYVSIEVMGMPMTIDAVAWRTQTDFVRCIRLTT